LRDADVIVVGAGAAGLAAAAVLSRAGRDVLLLEARPRIGGRIHTLRPADWPLPVELGAEFIHGQPPETWELARESGALVEEIPDAHWVAGRAGLGPLRDLWGQMESMTATIPRKGRDVSFREFLRKSRRIPAPQRRRVLQFVSGFHAAQTDRISARSLSTQGEGPSQPEDKRQHRIISGQDGLVDALWGDARRAKARLRLRSPVFEIRWREGRVVARARRSGRTEELEAGAAIVTVPLGVLRAPAGRAGAIRFIPEITAKRPALERLEMGHVLRVVLRFREAFWDERGFLERRLAPGARDEDPRLGYLHDFRASFPTWWSALPARAAVLTGWAGGDAAVPFRGRPAGDVAGAAVRSLAKSLGLRAGWLERRLLGAHLHDWSRDPFARGAYSYAAVGGAGAARRLARPIAATLFFAGEATDPEQTGTVSGAIASGRRAASQLLRAR
jgi:monoamine oxidase